MKMCVKVGCTVLFIQAKVDSACARAMGSVGKKPICGNSWSRCKTMAKICVMGRPPLTNTGTWPRGLMAW